MNFAYLLLGSNIQPEQNIPLALNALVPPQVTILAQSQIWKTPSVGSPGPDFLNQAIHIASPLGEQELKFSYLRKREENLGRVRTVDKNAPRTIDLDIIVFNGKVLDPNLWAHAHIAIPLAELIPNLPTAYYGLSLAEVARRLNVTGVARLFSTHWA